MPTFKVTDPNTGKTLKLTGDSPPSEQELEQIFSSQQSQADISAESFLSENAPDRTQRLNPNFGTIGTNEAPQQPFQPNQNLGQSPVAEVPVSQQGTPITSTKEFLSDTKQFGESLKNESLPIGGAIVGGILGGPGGAALGAAGGEGFKQVLQNFGFFGGDAPKTSGEAAERIGTEALIGGTGEGLARIAVGTGAKAGRGFSKSVTPEGKEALRFFKGSDITLNPAKVTDSRVLDVASNAGEASFISGDKFLKGQLRAAEFVDDAVDDLVTSMRTSDRVLAGDLVQDAISGNQLAFKTKSIQLYKNLDEIIDEKIVRISRQQGFKAKSSPSRVGSGRNQVGVETRINPDTGNIEPVTRLTSETRINPVTGNVENVAQPIPSKGVSGGGGSRTAGLETRINPETGLIENIPNIVEKNIVTRGRVDLRGLKKEANRLLQEAEAGAGTASQKSLLKEVARKNDFVTFSDAHTLRSTLLTRGRVGSDPLANQTVGIAKKLSGDIDSLMSKSAEKIPGAKEAWRQANSFWKKGKEVFNDKLIKKMVEEDASQVSKKIFTSAKDNPAFIRRVRKAIGNDTETWRALQGEVMDKIVKDSLDIAGVGTTDVSNIVSSKLLKSIKAFGGQDEVALRAMFPARQDRVLAKLARIKGLILKGQPDSTGRFAVQIGQIAALASVASGKFSRRAASILLGPEAISRAFQKPSIARFITEGLKINPKTAAGLKQLTLFTTRLAVLLNKEGIAHEVIDPLQDSFGAGIIEQGAR